MFHIFFRSNDRKKLEHGPRGILPFPSASECSLRERLPKHGSIIKLSPRKGST